MKKRRLLPFPIVLFILGETAFPPALSARAAIQAIAAFGVAAAPAKSTVSAAVQSAAGTKGTASGVEAETAANTENRRALGETLAAAMSDEDALAQTFMFGWQGDVPSPLILQWIRNRHIGGVKVFGWNARDTGTLTRALSVMQNESHTAGSLPLLIATDQEGGIVRHVKGETSDTPGNMAIGASGFPADAYRAGYYIGRELARLGINMNFAPAVDLATRRDSELIGPRSFGADPVRAGILGAAFVKGQAAAGIISTAKHFPGHGDTALDSHTSLPRIMAGEDILWERELVPYRILVKEGVPAIMSGHLAFPATPAGETPASLSPYFLTALLRERMGYRGLIITDDLLMHGAVKAGGSLANAAREALAAGNDMILVSSTPALSSSLWTELLAEMRAVPAFRARIREAAVRVAALKLILPAGPPDPAEAEKHEASGAFFLDLAARSVTSIGGKGSAPAAALPPALQSAGRVLLAGQYPAFIAAGRKAYPGAAVYLFGDQGSAAELQRLASGADTVIFCLAGAESRRLLESINRMGKTAIVVSALNPAHLAGLKLSGPVFAVYSYSEPSFTAVFSVLAGRYMPRGTLP